MHMWVSWQCVSNRNHATAGISFLEREFCQKKPRTKRGK